METQGTNLFIVDDNLLSATDLKHYLQNRFGKDIIVTIFENGESCLLKVNNDTHIVILDYFLEGKNGLEILKSIKKINPATEVIMLSGNEDMGLAIETFRAGAKDYVIKGSSSWKRISKLVSNILLAPIKVIVREFGVSKFAAIFLTTFISVGIVVFIAMQLMKK
jgi:DNA-binding NarL/FixJ family response regulator